MKTPSAVKKNSAKTAEEILDTNLQLWSLFYPQEAIRLGYLDVEEYRIEGDELIGPKGSYKVANPQKWFDQLTIKNEKSLVVYGIGLGDVFDPIKVWLKEDKTRKVFFFEEDPSVLNRFFSTTRATEVLSHPQVEIHCLKELKDEDPALEKFFWSSAMQQAVVGTLPAYAHWYNERAQEFAHLVLHSLEMKNGLIDEYLMLGVSFFRSFYFNVLDLPDSYLGNKLFKKFEGIPAIICGAGPSLEKQFSKLGDLKDKALIFTGGSSLNALSHAGILPHFSCGLDPNTEQAVRIKTNNAGNVPFFYRNRMFVGAFREITGPKLYITGSGGYDISDYYENRLGIESEFIDEGHNVINFLCEITTRLGCNPILFVGLDLAYTDFKSYSKGVVDDYKFTQKTLPSEAVLKKDTQGNPIWTEWKWISEQKWITQFAEEHPNFKLVNCTEGGLGIQGIEALTLEEASKKYLKKSYDLAPKLSQAFEEAKKKSITREKVRKLTRDLQKSLENAVEKLDVLEIDTKDRLKNDPLRPTSGPAAMAEIEIMEEIGYVYILEIFNKVYSHLQGSKLRALRISQGKKSPKFIEKEKLKLQLERIRFLKRVADINNKLINLALNEKCNKASRSSIPYLD